MNRRERRLIAHGRGDQGVWIGRLPPTVANGVLTRGQAKVGPRRGNIGYEFPVGGLGAAPPREGQTSS